MNACWATTQHLSCYRVCQILSLSPRGSLCCVVCNPLFPWTNDMLYLLTTLLLSRCLFATTFVSIFFHISLSGINLCLFTFQYRIALATIQKKKKKRERVSAKPGNSIIWLFSRLNHALFVHYRLGLWTVDYMLLYLITQTKPIHYFDENKDGIVNRLNWRTILYGHYLYEQLGSAQLWALEQIHLH